MRVVKELWIHLRIYTKKLHDTILLSKPRIYYIFKMYEKMRLKCFNQNSNNALWEEF